MYIPKYTIFIYITEVHFEQFSNLSPKLALCVSLTVSCFRSSSHSLRDSCRSCPLLPRKLCTHEDSLNKLVHPYIGCSHLAGAVTPLSGVKPLPNSDNFMTKPLKLLSIFSVFVVVYFESIQMGLSGANLDLPLL